MSGRRTLAIDLVLQEASARRDVPGVVAAAATRGGGIYSGAFGSANCASGEPMKGDELFFVASMTKGITAVAAMQLVERGKLSLERPIGELLPELATPRILVGYDEAGSAILRPASVPITLRHLLTHTSGFAYGHWHANARRYSDENNVPDTLSYSNASLNVPLVSEPGEEWHYGIGMEFVGKAVEAVSGQRLDQYFQQHIFEPLGMVDSHYLVPPEKRDRVAKIHARQPDGTLAPVEIELPASPEFFPGGVGLYSTANDYLNFAQMLLHQGAFRGRRLLKASTVRMMGRNHLGRARVTPMISQIPFWSEDINLFPDQPQHWGLSFLLNTGTTKTGRRAGTLTWAGACNSFYWIDRKRGLAAVFMASLVPFGDARALGVLNEFERAVYQL